MTPSRQAGDRQRQEVTGVTSMAGRDIHCIFKQATNVYVKYDRHL